MTISSEISRLTTEHSQATETRPLDVTRWIESATHETMEKYSLLPVLLKLRGIAGGVTVIPEQGEQPAYLVVEIGASDYDFASEQGRADLEKDLESLIDQQKTQMRARVAADIALSLERYRPMPVSSRSIVQEPVVVFQKQTE